MTLPTRPAARLSLAAALSLTAVLSAAGSMTSANAADVLRTGSFQGRDGHRSSGTVQIVKDGAVTKVVFAGNFYLDGAPDPRVAFGNGRYVQGTIISRLRRNRGGQEYVVPSHFKVGQFSQVWLWCKKFNSPIAVANLN